MCLRYLYLACLLLANVNRYLVADKKWTPNATAAAWPDKCVSSTTLW